MSEIGRLLNKVAILTGSSRGIGKAIALEFARQGARIVVGYNRDKAKAEAVVYQIITNGGDAFAIQLDVRDRSSVRAMFKTAHDRFGRVDVLVNNAGFLEQKPFMNITDDDWNYSLAVNLTGVFVCIQEVVQFFEGQKSGCIINMTSVGGQIGGAKAPHYAAAKAGVIALTKSTARLLAPMGVRVNAIAPGFIRTDMYTDIISRTPESQINADILLERVGEPEEVATAAVFLASDDACYITGHILNVNGGLYLG